MTFRRGALNITRGTCHIYPILIMIPLIVMFQKKEVLADRNTVGGLPFVGIWTFYLVIKK